MGIPLTRHRDELPRLIHTWIVPISAKAFHGKSQISYELVELLLLAQNLGPLATLA
jgi:hypothetical protein